LVDEKTVKRAAHAMKVGAKEKNMKLYIKMIKLLSVNISTHGSGFLEEVSLDILQIIL